MSQKRNSIFPIYEGSDQSIEDVLLKAGFSPEQKILTRGETGHVICHFIKIRDNSGRTAYVELDCDDSMGMGYMKVNSNDPILSQSNQLSKIPYSMKMGSFESNKGEIYGIGFECYDSVCIITRKDKTLEPVETVYMQGEEASENSHPVPFPIIRMTEILSNPKAVRKNMTNCHARMRNVAFNTCTKELDVLKQSTSELQKEIDRFLDLSQKVAASLKNTIEQLETMNNQYETQGIKTEKHAEKLKLIRFNLAKRNDLILDYISLCDGMKERSEKLESIKNEIRDLNDFSDNLFSGLTNVFKE